ncbi:MAG: phosphate transport system permease protein, partial [Gammaproteobacteria bacterium]
MSNTEIVKQGLRKRYAREMRFRLYGRLAVLVGFVFLAILLVDIITRALPAFSATEIRLQIPMDFESLGLESGVKPDRDAIQAVNFSGLVKASMRQAFPEVEKRKDKKRLYKLISSSAEFEIRDRLLANPGLIGGKALDLWLKADDDVDTFFKFAAVTSRIDEKQTAYIEALKQRGDIRTSFNTTFFTASDSREPEQAGIRGALLGTFWTLLVTMIVSLPIGIASAIYLEEFAPKNRITDFIEININ